MLGCQANYHGSPGAELTLTTGDQQIRAEIAGISAWRGDEEAIGSPHPITPGQSGTPRRPGLDPLPFRFRERPIAAHRIRGGAEYGSTSSPQAALPRRDRPVLLALHISRFDRVNLYACSVV